MKRIYLIILFITSSICLFSQKEANIWYFGYEAGIDFNSGVAVALTNSAMSQREGCASISDGEGNLLFYTDGQTVYNKNHSTMQNGSGLQGGQSSSQSAIIIPFPGDAEKYYIFTVPEEIGSGNSGIKYSVVDLTLDGGLGAITNEKNIFLITPSMERITGVRHHNGKDIWMITHLWNSNAFYAYLITESGINTNPVISNAGSYQSGMQGLAHGTMKVSANGKKLGMAARPNDSFELFDFDNSTGIVSNCIYFPATIFRFMALNFRLIAQNFILINMVMEPICINMI